MKKFMSLLLVGIMTVSYTHLDVYKRQVLGSSMKMREIAERCGYSDQHYFSYCFKKYCGVSPNAMRQEKE